MPGSSASGSAPLMMTRSAGGSERAQPATNSAASRREQVTQLDGPFHEPTHPRPLPGGEQASVRVLSVPLLGGVRGGFMVPMHAPKRMEAFHENENRARYGQPRTRVYTSHVNVGARGFRSLV